MWDELDQGVWIPVLSDILEFFHIHLSFSMLDVILMVGAIPATLATPCALKNPVMQEIAAASSSLAMLGKLIFTIKGWVSGEDKKVAAGFDAVFAVIAMTATCYHFYELSQLPESKERKEANLVEAANMCNYFRRLAGFGAQMAEDPDTKAAMGLTMGVLGMTWGSLQIAAAEQE